MPFIAGVAFDYPLEPDAVDRHSRRLLHSRGAGVRVPGIDACRGTAETTVPEPASGPRRGAIFAFAGVVDGRGLWVEIAGWFASRIAVGPLIDLTRHGAEPGSAGRGGELGDVDGRSRVHRDACAVAWSALETSWSMRLYARDAAHAQLVGFVAFVLLIAYFALTRLNVNVSTYSAILYKAVEDGYMRHGHSVRMARRHGASARRRLRAHLSGLGGVPVLEVRRAGDLRVQMSTIVGAKVIAVLFALLRPATAGQATLERSYSAPASIWRCTTRRRSGSCCRGCSACLRRRG